MKIIVRDMVRKAPKPDELDKAFGADESNSDESEPMDEDADMAAYKSAVSDFVDAVKAGKSDEAADYLREAIEACK